MLVGAHLRVCYSPGSLSLRRSGLGLSCTQGSDLEDEDMEELLNDTRLLKKFKKGKITEEELEKGLLTSAKGPIRTAGLGTSDVEGDG